MRTTVIISIVSIAIVAWLTLPPVHSDTTLLVLGPLATVGLSSILQRFWKTILKYFIRTKSF